MSSLQGGARRVFIGTAGWSIDREVSSRFPQEGSALERYASLFSAAEINSSFHRRHRKSTWQRWHDSVPPHFRLSVKLPKVITHTMKLAETAGEVDLFFEDILPLGNKLGPILVQLPPSLAYDPSHVQGTLWDLRQRTGNSIVLEPRHPSWGSSEAIAALASLDVRLVNADPQNPTLRAAAKANTGFAYLRLHGFPRMYYSSYSSEELQEYACLLSQAAEGSWCIFDNTASGAAVRNAVELLDLV